MDQPLRRRWAKRISWTLSSASPLTLSKSARLSGLFQPISVRPCNPRLVKVHDSGTGGETDSKPNQHSQTGPFVFLRQHKARRCTREIAVAFEYFVRAMDFHGFRRQIEL